MKRKELLQLIEENKGSMKLEKVYMIAEAKTKSAKKKIRRMIESYVAEGKLQPITESGVVKLPPRKNLSSRETQREELGFKIPSQSTESFARIRYTKDPTGDFDLMLGTYKIRDKFSEEMLKEANLIPDEISNSEIKRRMDLRKEMVVTIDGSDAKDLDDAVSLSETKKGHYRLGVHIADVSHYVARLSELDKEAGKRGNSFYFINRVVPMFPEKLSNGVCSLNPHTNKLTLSVFIDISDKGEILSYEFKETVIYSKHRLDYDTVERFFKGEHEYEDKELCKTLLKMKELFTILYKKRIREGSIDFDFKEQKIQLNENDLPVRVWLKDRQDSERLIEEFMLAANQCAAHQMEKKGLGVYRVHEAPAQDRIRTFARFVNRLGYQIPGMPNPSPKDLQTILKQSEGKEHHTMISYLLLRTMQQAKYQVENIGHFGLGFEDYAHYTSPIRRYADLLVHRIIKRHLHGNKSSGFTKPVLDDLCAHISSQERVAMESERDYRKVKSVRFMENRVGETFTGRINGVTDFGLFVGLENLGIDGMCRLADMSDDYYFYSEEEYKVFGKKTKREYRLGDKVRIQIARADVERGFLDVQILEKINMNDE